MSNTGNWAILQKDCEALLIPSATPVIIPSGTNVQITQQLGGSTTIQVNGQLLRIESKDSWALGAEPNQYNTIGSQDNVSKNIEADGPVDIDEIWQQLRTCYDPEIPVNVVDLGLIYTCQITPSDNGKANYISIEMTLTAPGCGMGPVLASDIESKVRSIKNVTDVSVHIVFEPVWGQERMSESAKLELGLL